MKLKLLKIIFIIFILVGCKDEKVVNQLENQNKLVDKLKYDIDKQNLKIDELNSYIASLEDEITEKKQELNDSIDIIEEMKQSNVKKDNKLNEQKNSIDILNNEVFKNKEAIKILEYKYGDMKSSIYEFINQYDNRLFIPEDVEEGDDINGMKIKSIIPQKDLWYIIKFEGTTELTGEFDIIKNDDYLGNMIFFNPNEATRTRLPHVFGDCRNDSFVISNYEEALDMLQDYKDEIVTIKIDEYLIDDLPSEVFNEAVLKEIY